MNRPWQFVATLLVAISLAGGCGRSPSGGTPIANNPGSPSNPISPDSTSPESTSPDSGEATNPATVGSSAVVVHHIPMEELQIGDYMPPLDAGNGGYVEIAKPEGWLAIGRKTGFLMRFREPNRKGLPRIEVRVETRSDGALETVTSENVEQFAKLVAAEVKGEKIVENVAPMIIGKTACARYVSLVGLELEAGIRTVAERQRLMVMHNGQLYTIDVLVNQNTLKQSRNAAYAVCASLRFGKESEPPATGELLPN